MRGLQSAVESWLLTMHKSMARATETSTFLYRLKSTMEALREKLTSKLVIEDVGGITELQAAILTADLFNLPDSNGMPVQELFFRTYEKHLDSLHIRPRSRMGIASAALNLVAQGKQPGAITETSSHTLGRAFGAYIVVDKKLAKCVR
eukprot:m.50103 g.50103  ORF g.50103 m.50103 type:complete len:148 (+) comp13392_c0_seq3:439-882(+)